MQQTAICSYSVYLIMKKLIQSTRYYILIAAFFAVGITSTQGQNHALLLNGGTSYVDCGDLLTPSYTKEVWIKLDLDELKSNNNIISGTGGHALRILIWCSPGGSFR